MWNVSRRASRREPFGIEEIGNKQKCKGKARRKMLMYSVFSSDSTVNILHCSKSL